ncbi:MAG: hypothetical protein AAGD11_12225 [Planctomycetota bacterium]
MSDRPTQRSLHHASGVIHEVRWSEICPWIILARALRVALLVRVLVLAAVGVVVTEAGWSLVCQQFSPPLQMPDSLREGLPTFQFSDRPDQVLETIRPSEWQSGTLVSGWHWLTAPFVEFGNRNLSTTALFGQLLLCAWAIIVWALVGGAISRTAAMYLARGETLGPLQAARDALSVWPATVGSPSITLLAGLALAVPLVLLGFLLRLDLLATLAGLVWFLVIAWGLMLTVVVLGLMVGWPLMWACMGVERSDAFDGVSRCYAYVYQRPLHFAFFVVVAAGLGVLGDQVVALFAGATTGLSEWVLRWGVGDGRATLLFDGDLEASPAPIATNLIEWWKWGVALIARSFPIASLWTMSVGIYLLLRRAIDATEMDEIVLSDGTIAAGLPTSITTHDGDVQTDEETRHADSDAS